MHLSLVTFEPQNLAHFHFYQFILQLKILKVTYYEMNLFGELPF